MKGVVSESGGAIFQEGTRGAHMPGQSYVSQAGLRIKMVNGEPMISLEDAYMACARDIRRIVAKTIFPKATDVNSVSKILEETMLGIGGEMERFQAEFRDQMIALHQTKLAVLAELKVQKDTLLTTRKFFTGKERSDELVELKEFLTLCERLEKLRADGFFEQIAEPILNLA